MQLMSEFEGGVKKFRCVRCNEIAKRHSNLIGIGVCRNCETTIGADAAEVMILEEAEKAIPDRLHYLFKTGQMRSRYAI